jgi:flagellar L-ring protein precursor FlgH
MLKENTMKSIKKTGLSMALVMSLGACGALERIGDIGSGPDLQPMDQHPVASHAPSLSLPMPLNHFSKNEANSLWRAGAKAFFQDQRASNIGDIVTVMINISDQAQVDNSTTRSRSSAENAQIPGLMGLESKLSDIFPNEVNPSSLTDFGSTSSNTGSGSVDRSETIKITVAAIVTQILPNGNFLIQGRQEVRVNFEVRELYITGIIRPEDISNGNTVLHSQIAEARISYGGRGQLTDMQQSRYGQQLYEILFPF